MRLISKHSYLLSIGIFLSTGCGRIASNQHQADLQKSFESEFNLSADSIAFDQILKAGNIYYAAPYILLNDVTQNANKHFYVYDQNLKFLYSFCDTGQGDAECIMPSVVKGSSASEFIVRDHATDIFHTYVLNDSNAQYEKSFRLQKSNQYESLWEINKVTPNQFFVKGTTPRSIIRKLINSQTGATIDSIPPTFNLRESMGRDYYSEFDDLWMVSNGKDFANAYFFINRIEFGEIKDNRLHIVATIGTNTPPEFFLYTDERLDGKYEYNVDYNTVYYEGLFGTEDKVYASYFGLPWGDINKHASIIESYLYSGQPCDLYNINVPLSSFVVVGNRIIGINPDISDENFYIYYLPSNEKE
ncbi:MAG: hypothetical protein K2G29_00155 [Muribaculaceae bacterium]|nr:hypothetical protein [Muribaculaceae bacterium]